MSGDNWHQGFLEIEVRKRRLKSGIHSLDARLTQSHDYGLTGPLTPIIPWLPGKTPWTVFSKQSSNL